jgi:hypothetical protein
MRVLEIYDLDFDRTITGETINTQVWGAFGVTTVAKASAAPGLAASVAQSKANGDVTLALTRTAGLAKTKGAMTGSVANAAASAVALSGQRLAISLSIDLSINLQL